MPTPSKLPDILSQSGLDVFLSQLKDDVADIKDTLKTLPTTEKIENLEGRVKSLESDRRWFVITVAGLLIKTAWDFIASRGHL